MYRNWLTLFRVMVFSLIPASLLIGSSACERLAPIVIENNAGKLLAVYIDDIYIDDAKPNDEIENNAVFYGQNSYLIEAYDAQGNVVYSNRFSEEEIKDAKWKVVITPPKSQ